MSIVTAELTEGTVVTISNGRHTWAADEPPQAHGTDTGPNPYELLLGSLAACTCITLSMYMQHKEMTWTGITVRHTFDRIHAEDCEDCESTTSGFIDRITSDVQIAGDFDEAQHKRLAQIAVRCPVHKTLAHGVEFADRVTIDR